VQLEKLAPHGVTEKIVRSPMQLGKLLFDDWKLPVLKENTGAKTGKVSRATDKEVLHELAFIDPRAKELRAYREALNNETKFAETPLVGGRVQRRRAWRGRRRSCSAPTPAA
jgi:DNA polymerase I-like protein with 3'-5' exonuclease and polymerase domains